MKDNFEEFAYDVYETDYWWWPRSGRVRKAFLIAGYLVLVPILVFQDPLAGAILGPVGPLLLLLVNGWVGLVKRAVDE